jgi:hypothetical protein
VGGFVGARAFPKPVRTVRTKEEPKLREEADVKMEKGEKNPPPAYVPWGEKEGRGRRVDTGGEAGSALDHIDAFNLVFGICSRHPWVWLYVVEQINATRLLLRSLDATSPLWARALSSSFIFHPPSLPPSLYNVHVVHPPSSNVSSPLSLSP